MAMIENIFRLVGGVDALRGTVAQAQGRVRRTAQRAALYAASGLVALVAVGFLIAALWVWLASLYGALIANLLVGGGLAILALAIAVATSSAGEAQQPAAARPEPVKAESAADVLAAANAAFKGEGVGLQSTLVAIVIGFVVGRLLR